LGIRPLPRVRQRLRQGAQGLGALSGIGNRLGALPGIRPLPRMRQRLRQGAQGLGALSGVGNRIGALPGGGEGLSGCGVICPLPPAPAPERAGPRRAR
jgi:hypothetical protein